jgi:hypothetical protein
MPERTYTGPLARGRVWLPNREVPFVRGEPVEFDADEVKVLDDDWSSPASAEKAIAKADKASKSTEKES